MFGGIFWSVFPKFALKKGKIFGADAPYSRVGFQISKSHTRNRAIYKNRPRGQYITATQCGTTAL